MISNSLDIDFIHGDIHGLSCKTHLLIGIYWLIMPCRKLRRNVSRSWLTLYTPPSGPPLLLRSSGNDLSSISWQKCVSQISMHFIPTRLVDKKSTSVQEMDWHRTGDEPIPAKVFTKFMTPCGINGSQWIKWTVLIDSALENNKSSIFPQSIPRGMNIQLVSAWIIDTSLDQNNRLQITRLEAPY